MLHAPECKVRCSRFDQIPSRKPKVAEFASKPPELGSICERRAMSEQIVRGALRA